MAFVLPLRLPDPTKPVRTLQAHVAPGTKVLRVAEVNAWAEAEAMLKAARAQADSIVAGAEEAFEQERQRGYAEGLTAARMEQAEKMIETVI